VHHLGQVSDEELRWLYQNARCLLAVAQEDFGLTPVEANLFGIPVVALRQGGYLETVSAGVNGVFLKEARVPNVVDAIDEAMRLDPEGIRQWADIFSYESFARKMREAATEAVALRRQRLQAVD
jgi:glycosyltransferase involved in cell wall biosynthesis